MVERDDDRRAPVPNEDPEAPASAEEIAASQRLRDALAGVVDTTEEPDDEILLALALRAAWDPARLSEDESRAVLDAAPTADEQHRALALREALAAGREPRATDLDDVHLARAIRAAYAPSAIGDAEHDRIVDTALAAMPAVRSTAKLTATTGEREAAATRTREVRTLRRRSVVVRVAFGAVAGGLALAASVVLVITSAPTQEAPLARTRTTQPLFSEPFKPGETSARIDRIASARAADFRDNRFTNWGVR